MRTTGAYEELQRRCVAILREVGVERSLPFDAVCARVEELRGRRLVLRELPEEAALSGVCGLWLGTDAADYIFYEARTAPLHREHIVLHEIGHVLCDHRRDMAAGAGEVPAAPDDDLPPQFVKRLMGRSSYTTREEQEAEMIASLIQSAGKSSRLAGPMGRLGAFLGLTVAGRV
ncbi:regulator component [Streptomyces sp. NPDC048111]|uniref:regulator component n=1 Tax=Streptomyces sp. NPDC048111 TaxID=3365500 RepID=UPI003721E5A1